MSDRTRTPLRGIPARLATERPRRVSEEHGWDRFEQAVFEKLESLEESIGGIAGRLTVIEDQRIAEGAERKVHEKIWGWVLGVAAALAIAAILALAGRS